MPVHCIFPVPTTNHLFRTRAAQRRRGHEVHLLTLTRGGATKVRHNLGLSVDEMGEVRLEVLVARHLADLRPQLVVSYIAYGISDFDDYLVTHAVVRRVFCKRCGTTGGYRERLAFTTLDEVPE